MCSYPYCFWYRDGGANFWIFWRSDAVSLPSQIKRILLHTFHLHFHYIFLPHPFPFLSQALKSKIKVSRDVDVRGDKWLEKLYGCHVAHAQKRRHNCYFRCSSVRAFLDFRQSRSKTGNSSDVRLLYVGQPLISRPKLSIQKLYSANTKNPIAVFFLVLLFHCRPINT